MLEATKRNFDVFTPYCHSTKVDVILMKPGGSPVTVQVKHGSPQKTRNHSHKVLVGSAKSSNRLPSDTPRYTRYVEGDFDLLCIHIDGYGLSFWHLKDLCHKATFRWDISKPINNWEIFNEF